MRHLNQIYWQMNNYLSGGFAVLNQENLITYVPQEYQGQSCRQQADFLQVSSLGIP